MSKSALDPNTTVAQLMAMDYRYQFPNQELIDDWQRLVRIRKYKNGSQFKPGMKLCQHFCDNFWKIENAAGMSFERAWQDPVIMDQVLAWGRSGMSQLWMSWIRRAVFMAAGLPNSSFYRPHFAKQIIEMTGLRQGRLFDPCAGWGGRMLGTVAAGWHYTGCEPNPATHANLVRMMHFISAHNQVQLHANPVEDLSIDPDTRFDVVLTSPPYFDLEKYDSDQNQSYVKHPRYDSWRDQWLIPLINRCLDHLPTTGISAWNVMKMGRRDLPATVVDAHQSRGWRLIATIGFNSPLNNIRKLKNKDVTYVFRHPDWNPVLTIG